MPYPLNTAPAPSADHAVINALPVARQVHERTGAASALARKSLLALIREVHVRNDGAGPARDENTPAREGFIATLRRQIAIRNRHGTPASILYFRLAGDEDDGGRFSGRAEHLLKRNVRSSDVVAILSSCELAVMLTHTSFEQAQKKSQSLAVLLRRSLREDSLSQVTADCIELAVGLDRKQA
ncbi:MAG: hypothetical protein JOZ55_00465 [Alphaproteobacteria bacterium]|nr:hypothetical protein [Alphaproteobacteria bacterium]